MSGMLSINALVARVIGMNAGCQTDLHWMPVDYQTTGWTQTNWIVVEQEVDFLWPRSSMTGFDYGTVSPIWECRHQDWEYVQWIHPSGVHIRKDITGIVVSATGVAQSGVTLKLFDSTDTLIDTTTSASDGSYTLGTTGTGNHYVVAYLPGSPDTAGTTVNTLVGV